MTRLITDGKVHELQQGDVIDLGAKGIIRYLTKAESEAYRLILAEQQKQTLKTIQFVKDTALKVLETGGVEGLKAFVKGG